MKKLTIELKSTDFVEVIELERTVTPNEDKRVDHVFVKRRKICKRHPEGFETEEYVRFDIEWPEEAKAKVTKRIEEQEEIIINTK